MPLNVRRPRPRRPMVRGIGAAVLAAGASITYLHAARVEPIAPPAASQNADMWGSFRADIAMTQHRVSASGAPIGIAPPAVSFHVERTRTAGGWRTTMTLIRAERPAVRTRSGVRYLDNPFLITRMESDRDGAEPRFYDRAGKPVRPPSEADLRFLRAGRSDAGSHPVPNDPRPAPPALADPAGGPPSSRWIDAIVAVPEQRDARRLALEERFGPPIGTVRGLDRFVLDEPDRQQEVLVDPDSALPVEVTTTRNGAPEMHTLMSYARYAGGVLARRSMHAEQTVAESSDRIVIDVELTNVKMEQEAAR
jgi:hypothetical protein